MKKKEFSSMLALTLLVMSNHKISIKEVKVIIEEDVENPLDKFRLMLVNKGFALAIADLKHCLKEDEDIRVEHPIPREVINQTAEELATLFNKHISSEEGEETSIDEGIEALIEDFHAHLRVHGSALVPNGLTEHLVSRDEKIEVEKEHVHNAPFDLLRYAR